MPRPPRIVASEQYVRLRHARQVLARSASPTQAGGAPDRRWLATPAVAIAVALAGVLILTLTRG